MFPEAGAEQWREVAAPAGGAAASAAAAAAPARLRWFQWRVEGQRDAVPWAHAVLLSRSSTHLGREPAR